VDGGGNIDTLKLNGSGSTLDLTKIINTRIQDIEKIDITGKWSIAYFESLLGLVKSIALVSVSPKTT
jgi:hypothetical protein